MTPDEFFMQRALELAKLGIGHVSPNPRVGCVVVHHNKTIGESWHKKFGEAHAEVNALNTVADQSLLKESTVYINLEPCSHFGKTPPCTDLLIRHQIKKVVIATTDPNPLVAGQGIKKLVNAGIEVVTGVLEKKGRELNQRFFTFMEKQRPYLILKWAQTQDGFIAQKNFESKWISNEFSRQLVHKWRSEEDAILVGAKTASHDNPELTVRNWSGRNPVRIVIDRFLRLPDHLHLFDKKIKTICYNVLKHENHGNLIYIRLPENNFIQELVNDLYKQNIQSVIVEGGAQTIQSFVDAQLWDEARIFTSSRNFGDGIAAPVLKGNLADELPLESDTLKIFLP
ncbi:MAG: diaminohydroxyphosphoribosylaminopyrimidine deaminase [Cytophagales bacterium]|jgi:diaminohydroxyphosphoribosylaminopyrimidine deaminase/5-amino-6-(5-phosphoribosylamino)uracil reductase|nr:bifunctional diaminohydroxyphosphoribosylaminopyrimidine deaminase/5-amino-6-(5-phosphoribosylamino)uracil reductase RibD [Bacteroidota bacterium]MBS1980378.1 bifunctional diaminohydroxyphosphoribosylaminopyrimidine deaminase/5-amino-6-(5-phosphoribosylamino)uracil reductase RibD [Bacteroidota bacterium]WHZ07691.1 MAG: diaminohydroxyphosphoribosylaminopyrimidine deaminase [Cytophagales bacterium]